MANKSNIIKNYLKDIESFSRLPESILIELLKQRVSHPECAAGIIFDGLSGSIF